MGRGGELFQLCCQEPLTLKEALSYTYPCPANRGANSRQKSSRVSADEEEMPISTYETAAVIGPLGRDKRRWPCFRFDL
jgi:hypothetical protein